MLTNKFFNQEPIVVAQKLLGKVLYRKLNGMWLKARIIETEAYYKSDQGSHASKGLTPSRKAMFMPAGTIYMYYSHGRSSMEISVKGEGNVVLIKSAYPYLEEGNDDYNSKMLKVMRKQYGDQSREIKRLCNGQTLLCQALDLKVKDWNQQIFDQNIFFISDEKLKPSKIIKAKRIGLPKNLDEYLLYRFIDQDFVKFCTKPIKTVDLT